MNKRSRYVHLIEECHFSKEKSLKMVMAETEFKGNIEEMAEICFLPSKHEQSLHIQKMRLTCDICKTNEHLVAVPVVLNFKNGLTNNVEYYCENKTTSDFFSKCWNHVQWYENVEGDNLLTLIQETA